MRLRNRILTSPARVNKIPEKNQTLTDSDKNTDRQQVSNDTHQETSRDKLEKLYEDIKSIPNYSAKINDFLRYHPTHSLHKRVVRKFPRRRVIARFPFDIFMADLIEYQQYKFSNRQYSYILLVIDCFTKVIYVSPMKTKSAIDCVNAFKAIFEDLPRYPVHLVTDKGKEFLNFKLREYFIASGVNHYTIPSKSDNKASIAERAIRTIKSRLQKFFFTTRKHRWIDVIQQLVENYNNTPHSSIGLKPVDVTDENRDQVHKRLFPFRKVTVICRLKIGDKVRKVIEKDLFEKGYTENWSRELYVVDNVRQSNGVCFYKIKHLDNNPVPGIFYYNQLNLVSRNDS